MAYHKRFIQKGTLGEYSKIKEEFDELTDAYEQEDKILQLCELCDLVGAIEAYAETFNISLDDLIKMKNKTRESFIEGKRK